MKNRLYTLKQLNGGDDGLFAKRDIKKGELVAYYSGNFFNGTEMQLFTSNQTGYDM